MNIVTLSDQKANDEAMALPIALYREHMIEDEKGRHGYFARVVNRGKFDIETVANNN